MEQHDGEMNEMLITLTSDIVTAHVANNNVELESLPLVIESVYGALSRLGTGNEPEAPLEPAVPIRQSIKPDFLVCLEDGKKMKMLKRHLMTAYGMTPDEYRNRWGLPSDYPMVAPNYAEKRRQLAKDIGLGRKPGQRRGRKKAPSADAA